LIDWFLESSTDFDMKDPDHGSTALYRLMAVRKSRLESGDEDDKLKAHNRSEYVQHVAAKLLDKNTELHIITEQNGTLFDLALISELWDVCSKILEQSRNYGFCDAGGKPFLHKLIDHCTEEKSEQLEPMAVRLIKLGCNVNQTWEASNPLDKAIKQQIDPVIQALLDANAMYGRTILHTMIHSVMQAQQDDDKVLRDKRCKTTLDLIKKGADVDVELDGYTVLTLSMKCRDSSITQAIMDKSTHLHEEQGYQFMQCVLDELRKGVDDNQLEFMRYVSQGLSDKDWPMMHELLNTVSNDQTVTDICNHLLNSNVNVRQANQRSGNDTALHAAAERGLKGIATKIINKSRDTLHIQNNRGETPLIRAVMTRQSQMVQYLVSVGSDANARTNGAACRLAALHIACINRDADIVEELIKATGIRCSEPGHWGRTPLHEVLLQACDDAAQRKETESSTEDPNIQRIKSGLLEAGADPNIQDADGVTPLMLAARAGDLSTMKSCDSGRHGHADKVADYDVLDTSGLSVFEYALEGDKMEVFKWLVGKHKKANIAQTDKQKDNQKKRLMIGALKMNQYNQAFQDDRAALEERGGTYRVVDNPDRPCAVPISTHVSWEEPLFWACYFGHADTVEKMLLQGCAIKDAVDHSGRNLLHWCSIWGLQCHSECLSKLIKAPGFQSCQEMRGPDGCTPMETAEMYGRSPNVVLLGGNPLNTPQHAFSFNDAVVIASKSPDNKYVDMDFPANLDSLVHRNFKGHNKKERYHNIEWCRPAEICGHDHMPRLDLSNVENAQAGPGANTWLLAAVAASHDGGHGIGHLFRTTDVNEIGAYEIAFTFGEASISVVIDDRIPCVVSDKGEKVPFFGGLANNNNIAFMLLEKALAKLFGSYSGIASGIVSNKFKESKMYENLKTMALDESVFKLVHSYSSHIWKYPQNANISREQGHQSVNDHSKPTRVEEMAAESIMYECLMLFQVSVVLGQSIDGIGGLLNTATMVSQWGELELDEPTLRLGSNEPLVVLPGVGTRICKPPCVAIKCSQQSIATFEFEDARAAEACRLVASANKGDDWVRLWRHPVPDHPHNFSVQLDATKSNPYIMCFDSPEEGTSLAFEIKSDKILEVTEVEKLDGLEFSHTDL